MSVLVYALVYVGSAIMLYNIVRYRGFMRKMADIGEDDRIRRIAAIPFALLIAFLVGYLAVALFGEPDLVIAGILFGGSLFVLIMLSVVYRIIARINEGNEHAYALYNQARRELENLTLDYIAIFRVNLTRDTIEGQTGSSPHAAGKRIRTYTELLGLRDQNLIADPHASIKEGLFERESLIEQFKAGRNTVEETRLCRMENGEAAFARVRATLVAEPMTGDVLAFIVESLVNDEMVSEALLDKALAEQYDLIAYLVDGRYDVVIGDAENQKPGSVFPRQKSGDYLEYLADQVAPVVVGTPEERIAVVSSLGVKRVEHELAQREPYTVDLACEIGGQVYYKRFVFYVVDAKAHFYLLLKSDTTEVRREELEHRRRLEEALEQAQRASKSKTIFLSNMSHDIRTPMNAIVGYTDLALHCDDAMQIHDYLGKIESSSKHLLALINDVLEMSRIESGKIELEPEPVNLMRAIEGVYDMFQAQVDEKHLAFTTDASYICNADVMCDKNRLNRVILNLLSNALKFTPDGGAVSLVLRQVSPATDGFAEYELQVKDTGIGMSPEFAERVFDAFERERTSTVSGLQGTGLGMAITKRIVDMMDGTIQVESAPGVGTEFTVWLRLPLADAADVACTDTGAPDETSREAVDFTGKRILLAEDNEINREIARIILEGMGFALDEAVNGQEALEMLTNAKAGHYDAVITDIQMPVMDGYETTRAIRALPDAALAGIPIVAMSANAFQEDIQAAVAAGVDGYVPKPVDVEHLTATLARVLGA